MMMNYETLQFEIRDRVACITLNRPDAANSLNLKMTKELMQTAICCDSDPGVRAVMITAKGKMFCAGGDLKAFAEAGDQVSILAKQMTDSLHRAISLFARMKAPVVCAVNGTAAGGGLSMILVAYLVLAAESSKFTLAYTKAGLVPDGSSTYFLPRLVGLRRARELILTNRVLDAREALEWQLVNSVVPDDVLHEEAESLAVKLAKGPLQAHGKVKHLLAETFSSKL